MTNTLELAKAHARMNIQDPALCLYGVRAALHDGSELFHLNHRELLELHHYACTLIGTSTSTPAERNTYSRQIRSAPC